MREANGCPAVKDVRVFAFFELPVLVTGVFLCASSRTACAPLTLLSALFHSARLPWQQCGSALEGDAARARAWDRRVGIVEEEVGRGSEGARGECARARAQP